MPSLPAAAVNPSDFLPHHGDRRRSAAQKLVLHAALWLIAIAVAFVLDRPLALRLRDTGIAQTVKLGGVLKDIAKFPGYAWCPLCIVIALLIWHPRHWRPAAFISLCAIVAGTNSIIKWLVGRFRPFTLPPYDLPQPFHLIPFNGGIAGLFHQASGLSFVSGHTALAFATAAGMVTLFPKSRAIGYLVYTIAAIVFCERIGENAHWLSDAVCGAALGVWGVALLARTCRGYLLPDPIYLAPPNGQH
jgi:membrane-associated phospholipid phosphatase